MRTMLQLVGGVAVAGAVAAGATAFTAPGVSTTGTAKVLAGGITGDVAITGAALKTVSVDGTAAGTYTSIVVTLASDDVAASPIVSGTVKALVAGTTSNSATVSPAYVTCAYGTPVAAKWNCLAGSGSEAWDTITGLKISVQNPGI